MNFVVLNDEFKKACDKLVISTMMNQGYNGL